MSKQMSKKVDGKSVVESKPEVEPNASRREMAMALAGIFGASAFLKGCAPGEATKALEDSEANLSEAVLNAAVLQKNILVVDTYDDLRNTPGDGFKPGVGVAVCRDPLRSGVFYWTDDKTTPASIMVFPAPSAPQTRTGAWKRIHSGPINVQWFGAAPNVQSPTVALAINGAIKELSTNGGGDLYFPPGYYWVDQTINVGVPWYERYDFATNRLVAMTDSVMLSNQVQNTAADNAAYHPVSLIFDEGAYIVADLAAPLPNQPNPRPVIAYHLSYENGTGIVRNLKIITPESHTNGKFKLPPSTTPPKMHLIGLFANRGCKLVEKALFVGLGTGMLAIGSYWCAIRDFYAFACQTGLNIAAGNAMDVSNIFAHYCGRGIVFDGSGAKLMSLHTEEVEEDLTIFAADCCTFGPAYFEDTEPRSNVSFRFLRCGGDITNPLNKVTTCVFDNIRIPKGEPTSVKRWIAIGDAHDVTFLNCRTYENDVDTNSAVASSGAIINCDFDINSPNWTVVHRGQTAYSRFAGLVQPGSNLVLLGTICYPFDHDFASAGSPVIVSPLGIADHVLGDEVPSHTTFAGFVQITSAHDDHRLLNISVEISTDFSGVRHPKIVFRNPSSQPAQLGTGPDYKVSGNVILHLYQALP